MAVDVKDLPPAYQAQALRKWMEQERKRGGASLPCPAAELPRGSKYHNKPTERVTPAGAVLRFDSQKEARRYDELTAMLQAGKIRDLRLQPQYTLQEAYTTAEGVRVRAIRYQADFSYRRKKGLEFAPTQDFDAGEWETVVEDVKSRPTKTRVYITKKKLMQERFGIQIQEV